MVIRLEKAERAHPEMDKGGGDRESSLFFVQKVYIIEVIARYLQEDATMTSNYTTRLDTKLRQEAEMLFSYLGMSLAT